MIHDMEFIENMDRMKESERKFFVIKVRCLVLTIYQNMVDAIIHEAPKEHVENLAAMVFDCFKRFEDLLDQDFIIDYGVKTQEYIRDYDEFAEAVRFMRSRHPDDHPMTL